MILTFLDRLDRTRFREFLHNAFDMTDDILLDRIFKYFDDDNDGWINREEWVLGLSVFLKGSFDNQKMAKNGQRLAKNDPEFVKIIKTVKKITKNGSVVRDKKGKVWSIFAIFLSLEKLENNKIIIELTNRQLFKIGNEEEHIKYCFDIYDLNGDGMISREEMLNMLKTSLGRQGNL